jgi:cytochrome c553
MKRIFIALFIAAVFSASSVWANTQIQAKHKGMKKDAKMINCTYCHTTAGFEKPKVKRAPNMAKINATSFCMGSGCHPVKK